MKIGFSHLHNSLLTKWMKIIILMERVQTIRLRALWLETAVKPQPSRQHKIISSTLRQAMQISYSGFFWTAMGINHQISTTNRLWNDSQKSAFPMLHISAMIRFSALVASLTFWAKMMSSLLSNKIKATVWIDTPISHLRQWLFLIKIEVVIGRVKGPTRNNYWLLSIVNSFQKLKILQKLWNRIITHSMSVSRSQTIK